MKPDRHTLRKMWLDECVTYVINESKIKCFNR